MTSSEDLAAQIEALIKEIDDDERSHYPSATTDENAVLALIQCNMEGKMDGLKECLKLAKAHLDRDRKMKAELANRLAIASEYEIVQMVNYPMGTERSYRRGRSEAFRVASNWAADSKTEASE